MIQGVQYSSDGSGPAVGDAMGIRLSVPGSHDVVSLATVLTEAVRRAAFSPNDQTLAGRHRSPVGRGLRHLIDNTCNNATSGRCQMQRAGHEGIDFASAAGGVVVEVVDKGFRNVLRQPHLHGSHRR